MVAKRRAPVWYTPEIAKRICEEISLGRALHLVCNEPWAPELNTVRRWTLDHPEFRGMYDAARAMWADCLAEEMLQIGDGAPAVAAAAAANGINENAAIQAERVKLDNRKWLLSRWYPQRYGDRIAQEITGAAGSPLVPEADPQRLAAALYSLLSAAAKKEDGPPVVDHEPHQAPALTDATDNLSAAPAIDRRK